MATWAPWNPASTKNVEPNRFCWSVSPRWAKCVNSYTWKPRKMSPQKAVPKSHRRACRRSPRCQGGRARTLGTVDPQKVKGGRVVRGEFKNLWGDAASPGGARAPGRGPAVFLSPEGTPAIHGWDRVEVVHRRR